MMIRRLFVYLFSFIFILCFITSCKKDSPQSDNPKKTDVQKTKSIENKRKGLVIRDDKTETDSLESVVEDNNVDADVNTDEQEDSQEREVNKTDTRIYEVAEIMPQYPGGISALKRYIAENTRNISECKTLKKSKRTMVSFIVEQNGTLSNVSVAGTSGNKSLDSEAVAIVSRMPLWESAKNDGKNVRVKYNVSVVFNPQNKK